LNKTVSLGSGTKISSRRYLLSRSETDREANPAQVAQTLMNFAYDVGPEKLPEGQPVRYFIREKLDELGIGKDLKKIKVSPTKSLALPPSSLPGAPPADEFEIVEDATHVAAVRLRAHPGRAGPANVCRTRRSASASARESGSRDPGAVAKTLRMRRMHCPNRRASAVSKRHSAADPGDGDAI
jgi:hypothetical protein